MIHTIHETDLFRPHQDPDDHWDLACQFSLAHMGLHRLQGVMIDHPPGFVKGDPDIQAVQQLNVLTGLHTPVGIGAPDDAKTAASSGAAMLLEALEHTPEPVTIHIVGSSRDVAQALQANRPLFAAKCRAVYLNAGSGNQNGRLEYNVELDPASYAAIFSAPCPVYWMPCFDTVPDWGVEDMRVGRYGTFYRFLQKDILEKLSPRMQNYFLSMLTQKTDSRWLAALNGPVDQDALAEYGGRLRNMWCTGGLLHAVGLCVSLQGNIAPSGENPADEVFGFTPIHVQCDVDGYTEWAACPAGETDRYLFTVMDTSAYPQAMTHAMRSLLEQLP